MLMPLMTIQTLMNTRLKKKTSGRTSLVELLKVLCVSLLALGAFGHSSNAQTGPNGGTIVSEETTVQSIGGGLEVHTTTTVEEVTESVTTTTTTEGEPTTVVSPNLLENPGFQDSSNTTNVPDWNTTGGVFVGATCGPGLGKCLQTGNETTGGGAVSQTVNLFDEMTKDEVNRGFNLEYGAQVKPHVSNLTVPVCTAQHIASGPDCKDRFAISVHVTDSSGSLLHSFEHVFNDVNFVGTDQRGYEKNDFFFTSTVPSNDYDSALATFSLFGEDQGFFNGFAGPFFDNTRLKAIYTEVELITSTITQQITRQIETVTQETIQSSVPETTTDTATIDVTEVTETVEVADNFETETVQAFEVTVTDNMTSMETTFEVSIDTNTEMTIEPIAVAAPVEVAEATVEEVTTEVEAQVAEATEGSNDISNNMEPSESSESNTSDSSSNDSTTDEPESQEDTSSNQDQPDEESSETKTADVDKDSEEKDSGPNAKAKTKAKSKAELKREIAQKVVQTLVTRLGQSTADQATQVALMNLISADITANQPKLLDNTQWYQSEGVYQNQSVATNNKAQYFMFGGSDAKMNSLVDSQWK